jgi:hypothetical protein
MAAMADLVPGWARARGRAFATFAIGGFICILPSFVLDLLAVPPSDHANVLFRLFGVALVFKGVIHLALATAGGVALRRLVLANAVFEGGVFLTLVRAAVAGPPLSGLIWILCAFFAFECMADAIALRRLDRSAQRHTPDSGRIA